MVALFLFRIIQESVLHLLQTLQDYLETVLHNWLNSNLFKIICNLCLNCNYDIFYIVKNKPEAIAALTTAMERPL